MNHMGELHVLSNIANPTVSVITNIGTAHIGNLGSRENILKAKLEILDGMNNGTLIINNDNDMLRTVKYDNLITVGIENKSDYVAHDIEEKVFSSGFYINDDYVEIPVGSRAFIYNALVAFEQAKAKGYTKKNLYDYAISVASQANKLNVAAQYAKEAYPIYGSEDPIYLQVIVNDFLEKKEYANAIEYINGLLEKDPQNATLVDLQGVCLENNGKQDEAIETYKKAIELNPSSVLARFHLGNILYNKAYAIDNNASALPQAQYDKIRAEQTEPLLREAAAQLEEAYKLDELNMGEAVKILKNIYYILGDEENLKRAEMM